MLGRCMHMLEWTHVLSPLLCWIAAAGSWQSHLGSEHLQVAGCAGEHFCAGRCAGLPGACPATTHALEGTLCLLLSCPRVAHFSLAP